MEIFNTIIDFLKHFSDIKFFTEFVNANQTFIYVLLFIIIFVETGLIVMPFLPGDSLLFAAGAVAANANSGMNIGYLIVLLFIAAFLGDTLNYLVGKYFGRKIFTWKLPFVKPEYLKKTEEFYEKYGTKTIIYARFVPIVRTFAPFIAGVGSMNYRKFITFNLFGGLVWISSFLILGYLLGTIEVVQKNLKLIMLAIIFISAVPMVIEYFKNKKS